MDREDAGPVAPQFWLVGGPNGAGKSTLARDLLAGLGLPPTTAILNPDSITRAIDQVVPRLTKWLRRVPRLGDRVMDFAGVVTVEAVVHASIEATNDVCVETVLSTGKYLKHVQAARNRGFRTGLIFVALPKPDDHVARVRARVAAGGHDVPEEKIRSRWSRAHDQLAAFAENVDHVLVFANEKLGSPDLIAEYQNGVLIVFDVGRLPRAEAALQRATGHPPLP